MNNKYTLNVEFVEKKKKGKQKHGSGAATVWFRDISMLDVWKRYAYISGMKLCDLYEKAVCEYIKNHPLDANQMLQYNNELMQMCFHCGGENEQ